ncbi:Protein transport protein got1 like protein [Tritrichomonas foetus]|uniref:Protein transport protein got1 like protein n=1 Tax=Tritrichomonas foetus TaxID=1144522 RepID=A0A1J4K9H5_9EUKA|nr:Protein transport protein got1 like protein [Tritrichomonas foetus]|eukprot:OHT08121.1 Protein transport protein got1 like protein [Tritrichomonas foetus]
MIQSTKYKNKIYQKSSKHMSGKPEENFKGLGTLLSVVGALSFISGILSGFNRRMMIVSNLLLIAGVLLVLGLEKFQAFMTNKKRLPGAIIYSVGLILLLANRNVAGGFLELIGFLALFGGFLPKFMNMLQKLPYVGKYFRFALPKVFYQNSTEELPL